MGTSSFCFRICEDFDVFIFANCISKILFDHISIVAIGRMILNSDDNDDGNHEWF